MSFIYYIHTLSSTLVTWSLVRFQELFWKNLWINNGEDIWIEIFICCEFFFFTFHNKKQCWLPLSLFLFTFSLVHPFPGLLLTFKCVDRLQGLTYASVPSMPLFHPYKLTLLMEKLGGFLGSL